METVGLIILVVIITFIFEFLFSLIIKNAMLEVLNKAIDVACYIQTYHYNKTDAERLQIGQEIFYKTLFGDKSKKFGKRDAGYIFDELYNKFFKKLLYTIPPEILCEQTRHLAEGERNNVGEVIDGIQTNLSMEYVEFMKYDNSDVGN